MHTAHRTWSLSLLPTLIALLVLSACGARSELPEGRDAAHGGTCDETTCPSGCCTAEGTCASGTSNAACGGGGNGCAVCPAVESCSAASRTCVGAGGCNATTCPGGCCDTNDQCQSGTALTACGSAGGACANCPAAGFASCDPAAHACVGPQSGCDPTTCPGCCGPNGAGGLTCVAGTADTACGRGGTSCGNCAASGLVCNSFSQTCRLAPCDSTTCPTGCCDTSGFCESGTSTASCGNGGKVCTPCPPGDTCNAGGCQGATCNASICPTGCCDSFGKCEAGTVPLACGTGGAACLPCPPSDTCFAGSCEGPLCNAATCPRGCCDTSGFCESGTSTSACGEGGNACSACPPDDICSGGTCQAIPCNASTCPTGCCDSAHLCETGRSTASCGNGGKTCAPCPPADTCNTGSCQGTTCNATTCPKGCCDGLGNCEAGNSTSACGSNGNACLPCPPGGSCAAGACKGAPCNAATCPTGCCDPFGFCETGTSTGACGKGGNACAACPPDDACRGGACQPIPCNLMTCPTGCCDVGGVCETGTNTMSCGNGGQACTACPPGDMCNAGSCQGATCNASNCAMGCCDSLGMCESGTSTSACGTGAKACLPCPPNDSCSAGTCTGSACNASTCPTGCCDALGFCESGTITSACGTKGTACTACAPGDTCNTGSCQASTCNAMTCPTGCCDTSGACQTGITLNDCGAGGKACAACGPADACVGGVCQGATCGFQTCPDGCCDAQDICQPGSTISDCGSGGSVCVTCSGRRASCPFGFCQRSVCNASTCPTGCCDSSGQCQPGNQTFDCGSGGTFCAECDFDQVCEGGTCANTTCNPYSCAGCCDANNTCQLGTTNADCGFDGDQCATCPQAGFCLQGACGGFVCGPTTCPEGCCDGSGNCQTGLGFLGGATCPCSDTCSGCCDSMNSCHGGTVSTECGSEGAPCVDCTALGETCDSDVFPVTCDLSCPAPYPGCTPGTTMPAPILAPGACHSFDLSDAAMACVAGAQTVDCQNFFSAEFGVNSNCANCLSQFDVDFADLTAIYLCAEPILSGSCDMSTGCANDCINVACEACQETTCQSTASNGECSSFVTAGNACIAGSPPATALCAQSSYPSFGAWLQGVGAKYCE